MDAEELKQRTKSFAIAVIRYLESLLRSRVNDVIIGQLLRSATSVGANYRAACRARSRAEFISKVTIVKEEADESQYWLELISELNHANDLTNSKLLEEANELTAIFTASAKTAKSRK